MYGSVHEFAQSTEWARWSQDQNLLFTLGGALPSPSFAGARCGLFG